MLHECKSCTISTSFKILEETVLNMIIWIFGVCSKSEPRFLQRRRRQYLEDLAFSRGSRIYIKRCICLADKAGWLPSGFAEIWHFMQRLFRGRLLWNTGNGKSLDCGKTIPRSSTASKFSSLDKDRKRWNSINYFLDKKSADIQRGSCRVRVQTFSQANCSVLTANSFNSLFFLTDSSFQQTLLFNSLFFLTASSFQQPLLFWLPLHSNSLFFLTASSKQSVW